MADKQLFLSFDDDDVVVQNVCTIGKIIASGSGYEYWVKLINAGAHHFSDKDFSVVEDHRNRLKELITEYYLT